MADKTQGIVILGHGSRYAQGLSVITETTARYKRLHPESRVAYAFIELAEPRLEETIEALVAEGLGSIIVVPLFLSFGHHIARDLPARMEALAKRHADVNFVTTAPIGADPLLCDIIQARIDNHS
ncbi:MAG: CbiX/SirB N-terminal domain-containing protein [Peptococcaceae bacterium]|nr:CbiX/SirB N-terminal domain-containing protein [Peptococcaceae bacterium]